MKLWGLTGGIASGKSTVASLLASRHIPVINADRLYHELISPADGKASQLAKAIGAEFGDNFLTLSGAVDRKALAAHVFSDPRMRARLDNITHPAVAQAATHAVESLKQTGARLAFYDVPLLYECGLEARFYKILVVWVPRSLQIERLQKRDGLTPEQAVLRLSSQLSLDEKKRRADAVIDNSQDREKLELQVEEFTHSIG